MAKTVKEIMSTNTVTATTQDNIYECAVLMKQHDIGFVPIVEGRKLVGVVTDRDLVVRGYAEKHSGSTSVTEVMTKNIRTVPSFMTVDECARLMADNQIRRLPVVEEGELVGVVSIGDLAIREIFVNEAGDALSAISEHEHREPSAVH
jgi:CBS domain-containing protein